MKRRDNEFELAVREALKGKKVPILVLDRRWHTLFPKGEKPADIKSLEDEVNELLKRQGFLVHDLKDLKVAKKKLMEGIVARMSEKESDRERKAKNQERLLLETKERIRIESDELTELPRKIQQANEKLLMLGAVYCFDRLANGDEQLSQLKQDITMLRELLNEKVSEKEDLEESMDSAYALMHGLLGHDVMNLYDNQKG